MAEKPALIRQSSDGAVRYFEVQVGGEWVAMGSLAQWSYPDNGKAEEFRRMADRFMALFIAAPDMLETLQLILDGEMVTHEHLTSLVAQAREVPAEAQSN